MAHLQYMPGDPRLVDQLVYELKSKGIFDQFRKDCIADVDTRPAYQNLRQRVENSVSSFLARQVWKPDLNKNQLREKLRKHILDGNYLEQGVERIVDQVVNPKLATVFVPKVEDLVYDYLGIARKKNSVEISNGVADLLPTDLEAVSPGSVKSNEDKDVTMEVDELAEPVDKQKNDEKSTDMIEKSQEAETTAISDLTIHNCEGTDDKGSIPLPAEEIRPEDIPPPENSPPKIEKVEIDKIELPKEPDVTTDIPLPDEIPKQENRTFFKTVNSDDESSSDSSLRRNMSPLTPIRSYNNENSCDAQQAFENQLIENKEEIKEPSTFRFALDTKSTENSLEAPKMDKNETDLSFQLKQVNINNFVTPAYEDSSNSNNLQIDYESDANSKVNTEAKDEVDPNSEDSKKEKKNENKKSSHKSSHRSRDSHKYSSSREKKSESKSSSGRDSSRHDKKSSKDDGKHKSNDKERSKDRSDKKENKDSSKHRSSSSHKSSHKDTKSHRSSSSSHKHSSRSDDKKSSSSSQRDKDKSSDKSSSKDKYSKDSKSSSHHSDKDKKSSSSSKSRSSDKDKEKKSKKENDDHYSLSGRGNPNRRSTDRDSNDGSSSSKGSHRPSSTKSSESKKDSKESTSKSENTSGSGSTTPSDKDAPHDKSNKVEVLQNKPIVRLESHLETPVASPPILPFVPDITLKKPKIAANFEEAKKITKMRKFLEEEQRRMNQEAALLLEFQANVRPSLSQVYSSIPGPELEFACNTNSTTQYIIQNTISGELQQTFVEEKTYTNAELYEELNSGNETEISKDVEENRDKKIIYEHIDACEVSDSKKTNAVISGDSNSEIIEDPEKEIIANLNKLRELCKIEKHMNFNKKSKHRESNETMSKEKNNFRYFAEYEKSNSEMEKIKCKNFLKSYIEKTNTSKKLYLINCDTYEENVLKDAASTFGDYDIISYHRNGHLKIPKTKAIVKNLNLTAEVSLPIDSESHSNDSDMKCEVFSPGKSDCSFDLSNDYDAKLEEMVNNTSRKEIMQIILGDIIDGSPSKMPKIDYITESNIDSPIECNLKRKLNDTETTENNNRPVLTPYKMRKMSTSELITSTTEDTEEPTSNDKLSSARSKYLGRAKRVGLPRPKRTELPNSPSSDKSVENYEQNTPTKTPNGKVKAPRHLVQRYETSDLYKPKLHFLSRRNVT